MSETRNVGNKIMLGDRNHRIDRNKVNKKKIKTDFERDSDCKTTEEKS